MNLTFEHRDGWLQVRVAFALPRGTLAIPVFRWGKMGPALGQIVAEWLNKDHAAAIQRARCASYHAGYLDGKHGRPRQLLHQDFLDG